jgi:uncharacterized membrane protein
MSWTQAKYFVAIVAIVSFSIGGMFYALGYPFVIPFSGLEAIALAWAFYLVLRAGERREILRLEGDDLVIETGVRSPESRVVFNRHWVKVNIEFAAHRHYATRLIVSTHGRWLEIGRFLTDHERESFARLLVNALRKNG